MKVGDAMIVVRELVKNTNIVPFLLGHSGVGKSEGIRAVARELNMRLFDFRLAQIEPADLIGYPYKWQDPETQEWITRYARPFWFPGPHDPPTLILLDELPQAPHDVRAGAFQLILDRRLFEHELAPQHKVVAAGNPAIGNYESEELGTALRSRLAYIVVQPDVSEWLAWVDTRVEELPALQHVKEYISMHPDALHQPDIDEPILVPKKPDPRGWFRSAEIISKCAIPEQLAIEVISGMIGKEVAIPFYRYMKENLNKPVTAREIVEDYSKVKQRIKESTNDMLNATKDDFVAFATSHKLDELPHVEVFDEFLMDLPREFQFVLVRELLQATPQLKQYLGTSPNVVKILEESKAYMERNGERIPFAD